MSEQHKYDVPEPSAGDHIHTLVRAGISSLPVVSGPATELFNLIVAPPLEGRRNEWMNAVADGLRRLEEKSNGFSIETLVGNDRFVSCVLNATQAAMRTHQTEKREALRNAVLNVAKGSGVDEDVEAVFLHRIDSYTAWHLRILKFLHDPKAMNEANGFRLYPFNIPSSKAQVLEACYPEIKGHRNFYDMVVMDLHSDGMVGIRELQVMTDFHGALEKATTEWGEQFLKFISG